MTSSNEDIFRITGLLCGEFTGPGEFPSQRPVAQSFHVSFDLRLDTRLCKQSWGWCFETPSGPLWHHRNEKQRFTQWVHYQNQSVNDNIHQNMIQGLIIFTISLFVIYKMLFKIIAFPHLTTLFSMPMSWLYHIYIIYIYVYIYIYTFPLILYKSVVVETMCMNLI